MAAVKLYEAAADRARLLYRIPAVPKERRTLELYHSAAPLLAEYDAPGNTKTLCRVGPCNQKFSEHPARKGLEADAVDFRQPLPFAQHAFDLVILHRTLDELACLRRGNGGSFDASLFFKNVFPVVATGGVVAGCATNRWSLNSMRDRLKHLTRPTQSATPTGHFTLQGVRSALVAAGFTDIRLFTLLPNCAAPSKLIDTDPVISRTAFRHEFNIARHRPFTPGFFARIAIVESGLNRHLEEAFFFWAVKPC